MIAAGGPVNIFPEAPELIWTVINGMLLMVIFIGLPALLGTVLWYLIRLVRAVERLSDRSDR